MNDLIISYSGLRGVVGAALNAEVAARYGAAFRKLVGAGKIIVGRDTRASGPELFEGLVRGLAGEVIDVDIVPTPTLQHGVKALGAIGGVCITASHNTAEWNGLKFFTGDPVFVLGGSEMKKLVDWAAMAQPSMARGSAPAIPRADAITSHIAAVLAVVDVARIRARRFKVAIDSGRGAGVSATLRLLDALGCDVVSVDTDRESEPTPERLGELRSAVVSQGCDVGFAQDLDADRLALCERDGNLPGEDTTLVLAVDHLLRRFPHGDRVVVKNVATTRALDDVVASHGARLIEVPVGEVNLSRALHAEISAGRTAFGGEGNGGVIFPRVLYGRDSLTGIALVLEAMTEAPQKLPHYTMVKAKLPAPSRLESLFAAVLARFPGAAADRRDGLKLVFPDGAWLIVRASNTEPIVRLIAESADPTWPSQIHDELRQCAMHLSG